MEPLSGTRAQYLLRSDQQDKTSDTEGKRRRERDEIGAEGLPLLPNHDIERDVEEDCEAKGELQQPHLLIGQDSCALRRGVIDGQEREGMECKEVTGMRTVKNSDCTKPMLARCNALLGQLFSCAAAARDNQTSPIVHAYTADGGAAGNNARRLQPCSSSVIKHTSPPLHLASQHAAAVGIRSKTFESLFMR
jgi:hypothetical protein